MTGHILKRGSKWAFKIDIGRDPLTGRRRQKWYSGFATRKAAEAELAKTLHQINTGSYVEPSQLSLAAYLHKWLEDYAKPNVSGKTYERYEQIVNSGINPKIGNIPLPKLQPLQIQNFYNEILKSGRVDGKGGLSALTVLHYHRLLHKALNQAVRWNLLIANPSDRVDPPRPRPKEIQALDEVRAVWLIEVSAGTRLYIPIMLALYTGMRRGEILALRWRDVDFENSHLTIRRALEYTKANGCVFKEPKSRKGFRRISLSETIIETLQMHKAKQQEFRELLGTAYADGDLVCCVEDGSIWKPPAFDSAYRQLLVRRKLTGPNFHALRHSHASQLLRAKVDPKVISERLGHSKVAFTLDQYAHLLPGMQEEAAEKVDAALKIARGKIRPDNPSRPN